MDTFDKILLGIGGYIALLVFAGIASMGYVIYIAIKKSNEKISPLAMAYEKDKIQNLSKQKQTKLVPWKPEYINRLSNVLDYTYKQFDEFIFNGTILTLDRKPLISFMRKDIGFERYSSIIAKSTEFELHFNRTEQNIDIEYNGVHFGRIHLNTYIIDKNGNKIGSINRSISHTDRYDVGIHDTVVAEIMKNTDRRTAIKNRFYKRHSSVSYHKMPYRSQHVEYKEMIRFLKEPTDEQRLWILVLAIYETIFYGFTFGK